MFVFGASEDPIVVGNAHGCEVIFIALKILGYDMPEERFMNDWFGSKIVTGFLRIHYLDKGLHQSNLVLNWALS